MEHKTRCSWVPENNELYIKYHDSEWAVPTYDDCLLYEMLILETFQAGLSWLTILKKRENFRRAFDGFDPIKVSQYGEDDIRRLMSDSGIIRNERKLRGAVANSKIFLEIQRQFGSFSNYLWGFTDGKTITNETGKFMDRSPLSDAVSNDMKKRGMKFVGSVTIYSYLQSVGVVNDHSPSCFRHDQVKKLERGHKTSRPPKLGG